MPLGKLNVHMQKNANGALSYPTYKKFMFRCTEDLNLRWVTLKVLEDNIWRTSFDSGLGNNFSDMPPKAQAFQLKIDKKDHIKL